MSHFPSRSAPRVRAVAGLFICIILVACGSDEAAPGPQADAEAAQGDAEPADGDTVENDTGGTGSEVQTGLCKTVADCQQASGDPGACREWSCDAASGTCSKIVVADDKNVACEQGGACFPGICKAGVCDAKLKECVSDNNSCTIDACDPATGKCEYKSKSDGGSCDDGDECSSPDTCKDGQCEGGPNVCGCDPTKPAAQECPDIDADICTGTRFCKQGADGKTYTCEHKPNSEIKCPDGQGCMAIACNSKTGKCDETNLADGAKCDDGKACTKDETCQKGACTASADTCCKDNKECEAKDTDGPCNGSLYCDKFSGACKPNPATVIVCSIVDNTACTTAVCDNKSRRLRAEPRQRQRAMRR